LIKAFYNSR